MSVSVLMTSPLTRTQLAGAIGESGGVMPPTFRPKPLRQATKEGDAFAATAGAPSLGALRALPAEALLATQGTQRFRADFIVDGQFLTEAPIDTYAAGRAARVPLLVGANSQEGSWTAILRDQPPTVANYRAGIARLYTDAGALYALYPAKSEPTFQLRGRRSPAMHFSARRRGSGSTCTAEHASRPITITSRIRARLHCRH
jgi:para-nitrobenzyl esterase